MSDDLLADLTETQRAAVTHEEGPLLVLAGAGSGKTRVITRRVAYLLQQGVRPSSILAITFTNKAAGEMRARVEALVPGHKVIVSTFHSLGARLLRQYADRLNIDRNFTIYDVDDRNKLVKDALDALNLDSVKFTPDRLAGGISGAKNQLLTPKEYERQASDFFTQTVAKVYHGYEKRLRAANGMDFDDLLYLPAMALKLNEELRADLDARFKYVLIDEYQDTNQAQYQIARRLSLHHPNICVVGDPDQCVPAGTLVSTPAGLRAVETIREGEEVLTGAGHGKIIRQRVSAVMANPHSGNLVRITLANGMGLLATSNHVCFARVGCDSQLQRKVKASFINSVHEAGAAAFHGWEHDPLPVASDYGPGLVSVPDFESSPALKLLKKAEFRCIRAGNLCPGLLVPVCASGLLVESEIVDIGYELYEGVVYDLTVPVTHNFIANGVVVHNSVYKWRHADIRNILDFERDFPGATVVTLEQNFRSTRNVIAAANAVIDRNKQRKKKSLVTQNPPGEPVRVLTFDTGLDEAEQVVARIKATVAGGKYRYRDHAIFLRINALSRSLESAFVKHGVPFQIVKGLAFFERKENKDVLAYLRVLVNPTDTVGFLRAVNEPARGIGKVSLDRLMKYAEDNEIGPLAAAGMVHKIPEIRGKAATGLRDFYRLMSDLRAKLTDPPHELIRAVLDQSGYRKMLAESNEEDDADRLANVDELVTAAKQFHDEDATRTLADFLERVALAADVDAWDEAADHVSVMTLHSAKGLEFPVVYMLAMEQGLLPHERSLQKPDDVEEERRLCFVGMTRAMKELNLCRARLREVRGQSLYAVPSMFLDELPGGVEHVDVSANRHGGRAAVEEWRAKAAPAATAAGLGTRPPPIKPSIAPSTDQSYSVGQVVQHGQYGIGQIIDVSGYGSLRKVRIRFAAAGEKTFVADKVQLRVVQRK